MMSKKVKLGIVLMLALIQLGFPAWDDLSQPFMVSRGQTPWVITGPDGDVHMTYTFFSLLLYQRIAASGNFFAPETIPNPTGTNKLNKPHMELDAQGIPHVVVQNDNAALSHHVFYTNRIGGSWKPLKALYSDTTARVNLPYVALKGSTALIGFGGNANEILMVNNLGQQPTVFFSKSFSVSRPIPFITPDGQIYCMGGNGGRGDVVYKLNNNLGTITSYTAVGEQTWEGHAVNVGLDGRAVFSGTCNAASGGPAYFNTLSGLESGQQTSISTTAKPGSGDAIMVNIAGLKDGSSIIAYRDYRNNDEGKIVRVYNNAYSQPVQVVDKVGNVLRYRPSVTGLQDGGALLAWHSKVVTTDYVFIRTVGQTGFVPKKDVSVEQTPFPLTGSDAITVYPNPMVPGQAFHFRGGFNQLRLIGIYDIRGKMVTNRCGAIYQTAPVSAGTYFLLFANNENIKRIKFNVMK